MSINYDAHIHIALTNSDYKLAKSIHEKGDRSLSEQHIRKAFETYKSFGISYLRDGGDKWGVSLLAKKVAPEYGITYLTPSFAIYKNGFYGSILGIPFNDFVEYKSLVLKAKADGADFIKIMASGIMDFSEYGRISPCELSSNELKDMVSFANDNDLKVMAHCNGENIEKALLAGVSTIEHGFFMNKAYVDIMKDNNTVWIPTVAPVLNLLFAADADKFNPEVINKILENHYEMIKYAVSLDLPIGVGSDAGSFMVPIGESSVFEYNLLYKKYGDSFDALCSKAKNAIFD